MTEDILKKGNAGIYPTRKALKKALKASGFFHQRNIKNRLKFMDINADDVLKKIPLPELDFSMTIGSLANFLDSMITESFTGKQNPFLVQYIAWEDENTFYLLDSRTKVLDDGIKSSFVLTRKNKFETASCYDMNTGKWIKRTDLDAFLTEEIDMTPESDILRTLESGFGIPVSMADPKNINEMIEQYKPLFGLRDDIGTCGQIRTAVYSEKADGKERACLIPLLTARNRCLMGTGIIPNTDGSFSICRIEPDTEKTEQGGVYYVTGCEAFKSTAVAENRAELSDFLIKLWKDPEDGQIHDLSVDEEMNVTECEYRPETFFMP